MMKNSAKTIILTSTLAAIAALLLTGCREKKYKEPAAKPAETVIDSLEQDTMEAFYERMRRFDALHGGTKRWEGDR